MIKIMWIVPSLEPGLDGVGDYTRLLGCALKKRGWNSAIVAVNDPFGSTTSSTSDVKNELRLNLELPFHLRTKTIKNFSELNNFHSLSLQWVGFGYEKRGLPWEMVKLIYELRQGRRLHVFFHEIWLGEKPGLPWKHRLLGHLQKQLTCYAVQKWQPDVMHTSNRLYQEALSRAGIKGVGILPLPGNIPVPDTCDIRFAENQVVIALFGSIDLEWEPTPFVTTLIRWAEHRQQKVCLISLGSQGAGQQIWKDLEAQYQNSAWLELASSGLCSAEAIAEHLLQADFGATTKSFELLGKSGAFAALVDFGLPVIALRSPSESRQMVDSESWAVPVLKFDPDHTDATEEWLSQYVGKRQKPASRLNEIVEQLLADLSAASSTD